MSGWRGESAADDDCNVHCPASSLEWNMEWNWGLDCDCSLKVQWQGQSTLRLKVAGWLGRDCTRPGWAGGGTKNHAPKKRLGARTYIELQRPRGPSLQARPARVSVRLGGCRFRRPGLGGLKWNASFVGSFTSKCNNNNRTNRPFSTLDRYNNNWLAIYAIQAIHHMLRAHMGWTVLPSRVVLTSARGCDCQWRGEARRCADVGPQEMELERNYPPCMHEKQGSCPRIRVQRPELSNVQDKGPREWAGTVAIAVKLG